jgi:IS1 family transposase
LSHINRNRHTHYGEQNHLCKRCNRQFVENSQRLSEEKKALFKRLLLERLSLRRTCRATEVSLSWLLGFIAEVYADLPDNLNLKVCEARGVFQLLRLEAEADEMWSFVVRKENKQWVWIAIEATTKQLIAFYVGDRLHKSARQLWKRLPQAYCDQASFATEDWEAYKGVIPPERHEVCAKGSGGRKIIERQVARRIGTLSQVANQRALARLPSAVEQNHRGIGQSGEYPGLEMSLEPADRLTIFRLKINHNTVYFQPDNGRYGRFCYSYLSAVIGSTFVARSAGM